MKDTSLFISQFLYRIRYWLLWGTLFVTGLVIYFTQFLPYSYTVEAPYLPELQQPLPSLEIA